MYSDFRDHHYIPVHVSAIIHKDLPVDDPAAGVGYFARQKVFEMGPCQ